MKENEPEYRRGLVACRHRKKKDKVQKERLDEMEPQVGRKTTHYGLEDFMHLQINNPEDGGNQSLLLSFGALG